MCMLQILANPAHSLPGRFSVAVYVCCDACLSDAFYIILYYMYSILYKTILGMLINLIH